MAELIAKKNKKPELARYVPPGRRPEQKHNENNQDCYNSSGEASTTSLEEDVELFCKGLSRSESAVKTARSLETHFQESTESSRKIRMKFLKKLQGEYHNVINDFEEAPENSLKLFTLLSQVYRLIKISGEPIRVLEVPLFNLAAKLLKASTERITIQEICWELVKCYETFDFAKGCCEAGAFLNTMRDLITSESSNEETRSCLVAVMDARAKKWKKAYRAH